MPPTLPPSLHLQATNTPFHLLSYGGPAKASNTFTLTSWSQDPANQSAWRELMAKHNLTHNPFDDIEAHFVFADAAVWGRSSRLGMNKARLMGWTGFVDTFESVFQAYEEMGRLGMLPPLRVEKAGNCI